MQAVILAGGTGKRLEPYTNVLPKPLIPLGSMPILEVLLRRIGAQGVTEAILCTAHLGDLVRSYFENVADLPLTLTYRREFEASGTAGPLRELADLLQPEYLVMNCDILTDNHVGLLMETHKRRGSAITIATHAFQQPVRYGVVEATADFVVTAIREKPSITLDISAGIYVLSRDRTAPLLAGSKGVLDMPDLIKNAMAAGLPVGMRRHRGQWFDIGEESDLAAARAAFARNPAAFLGETSMARKVR